MHEDVRGARWAGEEQAGRADAACHKCPPARRVQVKNLTGLAEWYGRNERLRGQANLVIVGARAGAGGRGRLMRGVVGQPLPPP